MSRLPSQLQPLWPLVKRAHRATTRATGALTRPVARLGGERSVPVTATTSVAETLALEPQTTRIHAGGDAESLRREVPIGSPSNHWIFDWRSTYDVRPRMTLDLDGGMVVGTYAATVTPGGRLDYETSGYFGISSWREHPIYLRPRLPEPESFDGDLVVLAAAGSNANYFHFVTDVLPRWGLLQECLPGFRPDAAYLNSGSRYQRELLAILGLEDLKAIEPANQLAVRAHRLLVPSLPNPDLMAPTWTMNWLKSALPAQNTAGLPRRLYLTRGTAKNTRRLNNEDQHWAVLEKHGFVSFDPGAHTVREQIDHFSAAEAIVAPHGAALTNLAFASPGLRLLELFAPDYVNPCYWTMATQIPDVRYRYLVGSGRPPKPHSEMTGVLTDIEIPVPALEAALEDLLA
ncbi:MAG: glycosyltransferase family 61 protein [Marmoricola sp.]